MSWDQMTSGVLDACMDTFGTGDTGMVTYFPAAGGGASFQVRGIWNNQFQSIDPETQAVITSVQPMLGVKLADFELQPRKGDRVLVRGSEYEIMQSQPDGEGGSTLMLKKRVAAK